MAPSRDIKTKKDRVIDIKLEAESGTRVSTGTAHIPSTTANISSGISSAHGSSPIRFDDVQPTTAPALGIAGAYNLLQYERGHFQPRPRTSAAAGSNNAKERTKKAQPSTTTAESSNYAYRTENKPSREHSDNEKFWERLIVEDEKHKNSTRALFADDLRRAAEGAAYSRYRVCKDCTKRGCGYANNSDSVIGAKRIAVKGFDSKSTGRLCRVLRRCYGQTVKKLRRALFD